MSSAKFKIGERCIVGGVPGNIRFIGETHFAPDLWIGVELDRAAGKNDGSITGKVYFTCAPLHGVFVRPTRVILEPSSAQPLIGDASLAGEARLPSAIGNLHENEEKALGPTTSNHGAKSRADLVSRLVVSPSKQITLQVQPEAPTGKLGNNTVAQHEKEPAVPSIKSNNLGTTSDIHSECLRLRGLLQQRLRILEAQRQGDAGRLSQLGALQNEKQAWLTIRDKLRQKLQEQQIELRSLKERVDAAESTAQRKLGNNANEELQEMLEMATLDREVAEEQRDALKVEVKELRLRVEEASLELELANERDQVLDTAQQGDEQVLARQNERLKEALIQLKELNLEQDDHLQSAKSEIEMLEKDKNETETTLSNVKSKLEASEALVEDLKTKVDISVGAELMLETLAERNLVLGEELEQCRATIKDLEALHEIDQELEDTHLQNHKELAEQHQRQVKLNAEQASRLTQHEEASIAMSETIVRFRELVESLQEEISNLRASVEQADPPDVGPSSAEVERYQHSITLRDRKIQVQEERLAVMSLQVESASAQCSALQVIAGSLTALPGELVMAYLHTLEIESLIAGYSRLHLLQPAMKQLSGHMQIWCLQRMACNAGHLASTLGALASVDQFDLTTFLSSTRALHEKTMMLSAILEGETARSASIEELKEMYLNLRAIAEKEVLLHTEVDSNQLIQGQLSDLKALMKALGQEPDGAVDTASIAIEQAITACNDSINAAKSKGIFPNRSLTQDFGQLDLLVLDRMFVPDASLKDCLDRLKDLLVSLQSRLDEQEHFYRRDAIIPFSLLSRSTSAGHSSEGVVHVRNPILTSSVDLQEILDSKLQELDLERAQCQSLRKRLAEQSTAIENMPKLEIRLQQLEHERQIHRKTVRDLETKLENRTSDVSIDHEARGNKKDLIAADPAEISLLRRTIRHLTRAQLLRQTHATDYDFLNIPLLPVRKASHISQHETNSRSAASLAMRSFVESIQLIDFEGTKPAVLTWRARKEQPSYVHDQQEDKLALLSRHVNLSKPKR